MTLTQLILFILVVQAIHFIGTWKLYVKAGRKAWEAAVPIYNGVVLMKIIGRSPWWVVLLFIPVINLIMFPVIWVETIRSFGKNTLKDTWLVILTLGFYIYYLNYTQELTYVVDRDLRPRTNLGEWTSSILFAIVAATIIHTYVMQPYIIPTSSLEKTLLVGDFLFVSKFHYGARVPMTTITTPMLHDTLPIINVRSYLNKPQLPYIRFPKIQNIKRNDIVVFSWPVDTVEQFFKTPSRKIIKPIDKKSNYVKRCVGIAGDTLSIINGYVYINGKKTELPYRAKVQYLYDIYSKKGVSTKLLLNLGVTELYREYAGSFLNASQEKAIRPYVIGFKRVNQGFVLTTRARGIPLKVLRKNGIALKEIINRKRTVNLTEEMAKKLRQSKDIDSLTKRLIPNNSYNARVFPNHPNYINSEDNFGPIYIPEAGKTISLNLETLPLYRRIIETYENNTLEIEGKVIKINQKKTTHYTFKQDYYWMMGDNRHNSEDSRFWGFVPADHIVGKPVFIWMSWDSNSDGIFNKIRWERLFTTVHSDGEPRSYFRYFLVLLAIWFAYDFYKKKKRKRETS